jgi:hypothetical protein
LQTSRFSFWGTILQGSVLLMANRSDEVKLHLLWELMPSEFIEEEGFLGIGVGVCLLSFSLFTILCVMFRLSYVIAFIGFFLCIPVNLLCSVLLHVMFVRLSLN